MVGWVGGQEGHHQRIEEFRCLDRQDVGARQHGQPALGQCPDHVQHVVEEADAVIVVTPTFQASYAGLFKSFVDLVAPNTLRGTPVLLDPPSDHLPLARHLQEPRALGPLLRHLRGS